MYIEPNVSNAITFCISFSNKSGHGIFARLLYILLLVGSSDFLHIPSQCHQGEVVSIECIMQVKVSWEARPRALAFLPRRSLTLELRLRVYEISHALFDGIIIWAELSQSHMRAHAVCDGVEGPHPVLAGSWYEPRPSPQPPSAFCVSFSQSIAESTIFCTNGRSSEKYIRPQKTLLVP